MYEQEFIQPTPTTQTEFAHEAAKVSSKLDAWVAAAPTPHAVVERMLEEGVRLSVARDADRPFIAWLSHVAPNVADRVTSADINLLDEHPQHPVCLVSVYDGTTSAASWFLPRCFADLERAWERNCLDDYAPPYAPRDDDGNVDWARLCRPKFAKAS